MTFWSCKEHFGLVKDNTWTMLHSGSISFRSVPVQEFYSRIPKTNIVNSLLLWKNQVLFLDQNVKTGWYQARQDTLPHFLLKTKEEEIGGILSSLVWYQPVSIGQSFDVLGRGQYIRPVQFFFWKNASNSMGNLGPKGECIPIYIEFGQCLTTCPKL